MSRVLVNLAAQGFANTRPVARLALLLWVAAAALLAADVWLYRSYFEGSNEKARRMAELEHQVAAEQQSISRLEQELAGLNLAQQNDKVSFLNRKIADRSFAWGRLFDRLAEILPDDVRLLALAPDNKGQGRREPAAANGEAYQAQVPLQLLGEAKTDEALLELVDALFADPAFRGPNPLRESRTDGQLLRFQLAVTYLPAVAEDLAEEAGASAVSASTAAVDELLEADLADDEEESE